MTKVKLNQNTRMACSRIFPSSFETKAGRLLLPAAAVMGFGDHGGAAGEELGRNAGCETPGSSTKSSNANNCCFT